jgi:hypothetical protein
MPPPQRESPGRESEASQSDSAADLKLASHSISDASPETATQLSRIETILDHIVRSLGHALGGAR